MIVFTMPIASEIEPVAPGICLWHFYDPAVKADLFSTAITTDLGAFLIDPVSLAPGAAADLLSRGPIAGIVVTNENHARAAASFADEFHVSVHAHPGVLNEIASPRVQPIQDGEILTPGLTAIEIDGAPAGEIAIHSAANAGTVIIGDALINFVPDGFAFLPAKYCSNARVMRRSLRKLLDYAFERMLFAHGLPILTGARQCLELLLRRP